MAGDDFYNSQYPILFVCLLQTLWTTDFRPLRFLVLGKQGYRNDAKQINHLEYLQKQACRIFDVVCIFFFELRTGRIQLTLSQPPIPSILFHCKKCLIFLYLLFPKIFQYLLKYNLLACRTSIRFAKPRTFKRCGELNFFNYSIQ